jgi:hypothetical protein
MQLNIDGNSARLAYTSPKTSARLASDLHKESARLALSNYGKTLSKLGASKGGIARMKSIRKK